LPVDPRGFRSLQSSLGLFRPALTVPGFNRFVTVFTGWVLTAGAHAVTEALVVTGISGVLHHEAFHRFFSRGTWDPDQFGHLLFDRLLLFLPQSRPVPVVIDDTLAPKKGANVFAIGSHLDAVRSTKKRKVFSFGHCWVVLAILVKPPFSRRSWALPVLLRLYRVTKDCENTGDVHKKKTQLAREMLDVIARWTKRRIDVSGDVAYCCATVTAGLPNHVLLTGAMRPDAALHAPVDEKLRKRSGRKPKLGERLPSPKELADDEEVPWQICKADLNGKSADVQYKHMLACWPRVCGDRELRIVVVRMTHGDLPIRVYFSMNAALSVPDLLAIYGRRWSIEVLFKELKQHLGFADSSARKKEAVLRVAPFVAFSYTTLVLWASASPDAMRLAAPPCRPWYSHKVGLSFADILRAARRAAGHEPFRRSPMKLNDFMNRRPGRSRRQRCLVFAPKKRET
jgi:hypothetical protein